MPLAVRGSGEAFCSMSPVLPVQKAEIDPRFQLRLNEQLFAEERAQAGTASEKNATFFSPRLKSLSDRRQTLCGQGLAKVPILWPPDDRLPGRAK